MKVRYDLNIFKTNENTLLGKVVCDYKKMLNTSLEISQITSTLPSSWKGTLLSLYIEHNETWMQQFCLAAL